MSRYDLVILHTTVGSFEGTDRYFRGLTNGVNSHFLTGGYGEIRQLVDTAVRSGANGAGNHRSVTVENADMGPGFAAWNTRNGADVPAFTDAQIEANAQICAWAHLEHGVPLVAADTSRPNARGIGYHRLGCNPWRVSDGELWSSSTGKVCPGNRRIAQIPQIIERARQIVAGVDVTPTEEDQLAEIRDEVMGALTEIVGATRATNAAVGRIEVAVNDPTAGALVRLAKVEAQLAALKVVGGGAVDPEVIVAAGRAGGEAFAKELGEKLVARPSDAA